MRLNKHLSAIMFSTILAMLLPGCDMYEEGHLTTGRVQVHEERYTSDVAVSDMSPAYMDALARDYEARGGGPVELTVTYDPRSRRNSALRAGETAARLAGALRAQGMRDIGTSILPVMDQGEISRALISFNAYSASPPPGCGTMPGMEDLKIDHDPDYGIGCTVEAQIARQVARPRDLAGNAGSDLETDGRRSANVVDVYRTGIPNKPLKGKTASE